MSEEKKPGEGLKYDGEKPRWDLLPLDIIEEVVRVLTFGAKKYKEHNWQKVENGKMRYFAACFRHLTSWSKGEDVDSETGCSHLAHAICSLIFVMWHHKNSN